MGILRVLRFGRRSQSGNVFFALFGAVALVGVVGASSMQIMRGPVRSMSEVTKRTVAENNMIASAKLALIAATSGATGGDCDADGFVEPVPFDSAGVGAAPTGGGYLPASIGAALNDPWDTRYGYCVWDHGAVTSGCTGLNYLAGENAATGYSIAIISAGPDRQFATTCAAYPTATALNKTPGTDDIVLGYTYGEASALSGGLWNLKDGDADTAQIARNLEVKDSGGSTTFALDADTGIGDFLGVVTNTIGGKSSPLDITGGLKFEDTGIAVSGACTQLDAFAFDTALDTLVRCNGGNWIAAGGSDNLGNHIATQNIQLGSHWLTGDAAGNDGLQINAAGAVSTSGLLTVGGNASVTGALGVTGATSLSTLGTSGLATLNSASVTGNASVGGTFGVVGNTTLTTLTGSGAASLGSLSVVGAATVGTTLGVTGATSLSTLGTTGLATLNSLTVTGNGSIGGDLDLTGGRINNMLDPLALQDAATKAYVDARVASGAGYVEADPQVGVLQATKWCVGSADGSAVNCNQDAPMGAGDNLGNHIATLNVRLHKTTGPAGSLVAGTGDNLGDHTATQNVQLGSFWINGDSGNEGLRVDSAGRVQIDQGGLDGSTYDVWIQGDASTTTETRNLALLGMETTDTLYLNYGGEYTGGTVIGGVISGNGSGLTTLNATNLASGTVPTARLGSGTANATTYLRGDGQWVTVSSGLPALTSANIWIGNGSNVATAVAMSGDATVSNTGVLTIGTGVITSTKILDGGIVSTDIADGTINSLDILDGTITAADIAGDTITAGDIAADAVGASELAANAVASGNIVDGTIATADLADASVTAVKLAAGVATPSGTWCGMATAGWTSFSCGAYSSVATCQGTSIVSACPTGYTARTVFASNSTNGCLKTCTKN